MRVASGAAGSGPCFAPASKPAESRIAFPLCAHFHAKPAKKKNQEGRILSNQRRGRVSAASARSKAAPFPESTM
jgi:hypothetical protein